MIRVFLVDDQTLVREGIKTLLGLSQRVQVVGEASDGAQAIALLPTSGADVVLMDIRMPGLSGLEVIKTLQARNQLPPTIILTTFDDHELVLTGILAGARGYLLKDVTLEQLVTAIETVHTGGTLVQPTLTSRVQTSLAGQSVMPDRQEALSERETEILRLLSGGYSNKEIANALAIAEGTVKNHVSNVLAKLGVRDRTRAVLKAIDQRLI